MDTFNKNSDVKSFDNFNFTPIVNHLQEIKEKRKNMTLDDKKVKNMPALGGRFGQD